MILHSLLLSWVDLQVSICIKIAQLFKIQDSRGWNLAKLNKIVLKTSICFVFSFNNTTRHEISKFASKPD